VIVDGERVLSRFTLAAVCGGRQAVMIEGLAAGGELHPMQAAFLWSGRSEQSTGMAPAVRESQ
jgi:aerobic-type carbon monoxide dehydrogenase small subunit (CoxS/CutS family)